VNKARIETLSDGIFAIAITLLVVTISLPGTGGYAHLGHQLVERWPSFAAYVITFAVIGIMWLNHHSIFAHFEDVVDRTFFYLNLLLMMTIAFLPYPTGVFGEALRNGEGARTAAFFYSATILVNAVAWSALWLYASVGRRLLVPAFPESERRVSTALFVFGTAAYAVSVLVALVNAYACLAFHGAMAVYYAFDPLSRRAAHGAQPPDR
jgi:TMEM175 potassium channel family protein